MHQVVGQLARTGEEQQPFGVEVKPTHRLPLALVQFRQTPEHGRAVLRVVVGNDLSDRLVVSNDPGRRWLDPVADWLAIDFNLVAKLDALANVRRFIIDADAALHDELLHLQTGAHARLRQHFVEFGGFCHGSQHAFTQSQLRGVFIRIKLARNYIIKTVARASGAVWSANLVRFYFYS